MSPRMDVRIREAEPGEEAELLRLYEGLFAPPGTRPHAWDEGRARDALADAIGAARSMVLVAERGGEPVGICTAYLDLNSVRFGLRCWVEDLVVAPERRSRGVGGALLDAAMDWAREHGATHLELDTALPRTGAQRFYERRNPAATGYSYSWVL
jgi:GNAT superfamily N-acetyltransferase